MMITAKKLWTLPLALVAASALARPASEAVAPINSVFIPSGFGTDEPYAVINGLFPNTCYSFVRADVRHNVSPYVHEVRTIAAVRPGPCLEVMVPYSQEASLGRLSPGTHTLHFMSGGDSYIERRVVVQ